MSDPRPETVTHEHIYDLLLEMRGEFSTRMTRLETKWSVWEKVVGGLLAAAAGAAGAAALEWVLTGGISPGLVTLLSLLPL